MQKERIFGLDIMRFAAIMTVLIDHLYWVVHIPVSINKFAKFSIDGVSIFFTLSGFLIGNILLRKLSSGNANFKTLFKFWKARWWRTLPAYYFILLILLSKLFLYHTRIDAVMFGVLGAYLSFYKFKIWTGYRKIFFVIGFVGFFAQHEILFWNGQHLNGYIEYWYKSVELFFSLCMIPYLSTVKTGKGIFAKFISFTAIISYSIYLVHSSIYSYFFASWLPQNITVRIIVYVAVAFGLGYLNYLTIEKWGIRQRGKINGNPFPK